MRELHNFAEIEKFLFYNRAEFDKSISSTKHIIEKPVNLLLDWFGLIKTIAVSTDDESHILDVLTAAFRRVLSSYVLIESGFIRESLITIRNYMELMLIAIDITYNKSSLEEWKKSDKDEVIIDSRDNWYFKKAKICARIEKNKENVYPEYARTLALGKGEGRSLSREWNIISSVAGHERVSSQIRPLRKLGRFPLIERATEQTCRTVFSNYRLFLLDIISLLIRIPKYREKISSDNEILEKANKLSHEYDEMINEIVLSKR